jgi:predicted phage tail protein
VSAHPFSTSFLIALFFERARFLAASGFIAGGPIAAAGAGLLADLGVSLIDKTVATLFDGQTTGLSERVAKLRTKSYQTSVYDFKKKYKGKIV